MDKERLLNKLKNLTVFQLMYFCVLTFVLYAIIDIACKKIERNKYDVESIVAKINERGPRAKIGFQNIIITYSESYRDKGGSWQTKPAEKYLYIRNGKLKRVKNFVLIPAGIVLLFGYFSFLIHFDIDIQYLKLKELKEVVKTISFGSRFFASIFILFFICLVVPLEIRNMINSSLDVTNIYLHVNNLDGYLK